MNKKSLIIAILLIFVVILSANSVFAEDTVDDAQLQQDENAADVVITTGETTPKTETVTPGSSSADIQEKINGLSDGDTLNFTAGEYNDISIYVNKSITINGNGAILKGYDTPNKTNTPDIIYNATADGGYAIDKLSTLYIVSTHGVTINGLTFIGGANSGSKVKCALLYAENVENLNISNNVFDGSCTGIYINKCPDGTIFNNKIENQTSTGILNFGSQRTLITENNVTNAANHGIDVRFRANGNNVRVIKNRIVGSKEGIFLMHSGGHIATENTIINCSISSITCFGSENINIYNNNLEYSRIGILLAKEYNNITIGENNYKLYRLPLPPIFTYYVAEAKIEYQSAEDAMGTYNDLSIEGPNYSEYSEIPAVSEKVINYDTLLTPTGVIRDVPNGATSAEIQAILDSLNDGDAIRFAENGQYYDISIYTTKNIKIIGNNATLYGLEHANKAIHPAKMMNGTQLGGYAVTYMAILYSVNNTNVAISNLNLVSRYPDHGLLSVKGNGATTPAYQTAAIYAQKSENIVITNCTVEGASFGIFLHFIAGQGGCANAIVTNNIVKNQFTYGILNFGSKLSYIAHNTVINAKWHGIDVRHQMGPNVIVYNNTVIGSYEGIYLMHSHGHKVYNNIIKNSKVSSISVYGSVDTNVNNIYVFNNTLDGSRIGIIVGGGNQKVTIGNNTYKLDAQLSGDKPGFGLYLVQTELAYDDPSAVPGTYNDQQSVDLAVSSANYGDPIKISVKDKDGKAAANVIGTITINGKPYEYVTDSNGVATVEATLIPASYDVILETTSNYYFKSAYSDTAKLVVNKLATKLTTASKKTAYLRIIEKGNSIQITLKDSTGKVIAGKKITIKLLGKTFTGNTNSKGIANVVLKAVKTGNFKATISFAADSIYKASSASVNIVITKEASKLTAKKAKFKVNKVKKYAVTLKSKSGAAIKNVKVTIKVKGKTYKAYTNKYGKAVFKLSKLNKKGTYKAVVRFGGDKYYNGVTVKPKIIVK